MTNDEPVRHTDFAPVDSPRVSIVVPGWRAAPYLLDCLSSIAESHPKSSFEVFVSLSAANEEVVDRLGKGVRGAQVLTSPVNIGFAGVSNRAADRAKGEFIVFLNDDAVVEEGWLDALVDAADSHPEAGIIGSRALYPDGTVQEEGAVIWSDGSVAPIGSGNSPVRATSDKITPVDYCSGVSMLVRRDIWNVVDGFDEGYYPAYYEDVDLCIKVRAQGSAVLVQPASAVRHRQGASAPLRYRQFLRDRNRYRLVERWPHVLSMCEPPTPGDTVAMARAIRRARERPLSHWPGPRLPDVRPSFPETETAYLRWELDVIGAYVAFLERSLDEAEKTLSVLRHRPWPRIVTRLKSTLRRLPGAAAAYRWATSSGKRTGDR